MSMLPEYRVRLFIKVKFTIRYNISFVYWHGFLWNTRRIQLCSYNEPVKCFDLEWRITNAFNSIPLKVSLDSLVIISTGLIRDYMTWIEAYLHFKLPAPKGMPIYEPAMCVVDKNIATSAHPRDDTFWNEV